jgi:hypothetical protein
MALMLRGRAKSTSENESACDGAAMKGAKESCHHHRIITGDVAEFNLYFALTKAARA